MAVIRVLSAASIIPEPANSVFKAIQIALVAATTAIQIATINRSTSFAKGGYTPKENNNPDGSGHTPVGVVHDGEYVVPKTVLRSGRGANLVSQLEDMRVGFASGGFAANVSDQVGQNNLIDSIEGLRVDSRALANRPVFVVASEVEDVNNRTAEIVDAGTIGG